LFPPPLQELPGVLTRLGQLREFYDPDTVELMNWIMYVCIQWNLLRKHSCTVEYSTLLGISSFFNIEFDIDNAITFHKTVQFAECDWSLHVSILCFLDNLKLTAVNT